MTANLWAHTEHALAYLQARDTIPHRADALAVLVELLPPSVERVLDLGTGDGSTLAAVLAVRPEATGVGLDFGEEMLRRARDRFEGDNRVSLGRHDLSEPLPHDENEHFDLVVSSFAIHHCVDERKRALYGEVFDALEAGGRFLNLEHVDSATPELHVDFLASIGKTPAEDDPSNKLVAVETQLAWLREIGFEQVDCHWKWRELALLGAIRSG